MERGTEYYSGYRDELFKLLPSNQKIQKVLDIGCAAGNAGQYLKGHFQIKEIVGVEINVAVAKLAKQKLDKVFVGDIETIKLFYEEKYFDFICRCTRAFVRSLASARKVNKAFEL